MIRSARSVGPESASTEEKRSMLADPSKTDKAMSPPTAQVKEPGPADQPLDDAKTTAVCQLDALPLDWSVERSTPFHEPDLPHLQTDFPADKRAELFAALHYSLSDLKEQCPSVGAYEAALQLLAENPSDAVRLPDELTTAATAVEALIAFRTHFMTLPGIKANYQFTVVSDPTDPRRYTTNPSAKTIIHFIHTCLALECLHIRRRHDPSTDYPSDNEVTVPYPDYLDNPAWALTLTELKKYDVEEHTAKASSADDYDIDSQLDAHAQEILLLLLRLLHIACSSESASAIPAALHALSPDDLSNLYRVLDELCRYHAQLTDFEAPVRMGSVNPTDLSELSFRVVNQYAVIALPPVPDQVRIPELDYETMIALLSEPTPLNALPDYLFLISAYCKRIQDQHQHAAKLKALFTSGALSSEQVKELETLQPTCLADAITLDALTDGVITPADAITSILTPRLLVRHLAFARYCLSKVIRSGKEISTEHPHLAYSTPTASMLVACLTHPEIMADVLLARNRPDIITRAFCQRLPLNISVLFLLASLELLPVAEFCDFISHRLDKILKIYELPSVPTERAEYESDDPFALSHPYNIQAKLILSLFVQYFIVRIVRRDAISVFALPGPILSSSANLTFIVALDRRLISIEDLTRDPNVIAHLLSSEAIARLHVYTLAQSAWTDEWSIARLTLLETLLACLSHPRIVDDLIRDMAVKASPVNRFFSFVHPSLRALCLFVKNGIISADTLSHLLCTQLMTVLGVCRDPEIGFTPYAPDDESDDGHERHSTQTNNLQFMLDLAVLIDDPDLAEAMIVAYLDSVLAQLDKIKRPKTESDTTVGSSADGDEINVTQIDLELMRVLQDFNRYLDLYLDYLLEDGFWNDLLVKTARALIQRVFSSPFTLKKSVDTFTEQLAPRLHSLLSITISTEHTTALLMTLCVHAPYSYFVMLTNEGDESDEHCAAYYGILNGILNTGKEKGESTLTTLLKSWLNHADLLDHLHRTPKTRPGILDLYLNLIRLFTDYLLLNFSVDELDERVEVITHFSETMLQQGEIHYAIALLTLLNRATSLTPSALREQQRLGSQLIEALAPQIQSGAPEAELAISALTRTGCFVWVLIQQHYLTIKSLSTLAHEAVMVRSDEPVPYPLPVHLRSDAPLPALMKKCEKLASETVPASERKMGLEQDTRFIIEFLRRTQHHTDDWIYLAIQSGALQPTPHTQRLFKKAYSMRHPTLHFTEEQLTELFVILTHHCEPNDLSTLLAGLALFSMASSDTQQQMIASAERHVFRPTKSPLFHFDQLAIITVPPDQHNYFRIKLTFAINFFDTVNFALYTALLLEVVRSDDVAKRTLCDPLLDALAAIELTSLNVLARAHVETFRRELGELQLSYRPDLTIQCQFPTLLSAPDASLFSRVVVYGV